MTDPNETDRQVEGASGLTYDQRVVPDPEKDGETTAVIPPVDENGIVYNHPGQGE